MHPISKISFGDGTTGPSLTVLFHNGDYESYGYILKQLGTNKFIVSDEADKYTCTLSSDGNLSEGLMTIIVNKIVNGVTTSNNEERIIKFLGLRKVLTNQGNIYKFALNTSPYYPPVPNTDIGNYAGNDPYALGKGVPANALTLNRQTIRLNGQLITLRRGS